MAQREETKKRKEISDRQVNKALTNGTINNNNKQ